MTTSIAKKYKHLSGSERFLIARMRHARASISCIAKTLGRDKSTISRELKRNGGVRVYDEDKADTQAKERWKRTHYKQRLTNTQRLFFIRTIHTCSYVCSFLLIII